MSIERLKERLPEAAERVLRDLSWNRRNNGPPPERWFTSLADPPNDGLVRDRIKEVAAAVLA